MQLPLDRATTLDDRVTTPVNPQGVRVFITYVKGTFLGMSESEEASKRR